MTVGVSQNNWTSFIDLTQTSGGGRIQLNPGDLFGGNQTNNDNFTVFLFDTGLTNNTTGGDTFTTSRTNPSNNNNNFQIMSFDDFLAQYGLNLGSSVSLNNAGISTPVATRTNFSNDATTGRVIQTTKGNPVRELNTPNPTANQLDFSDGTAAYFYFEMSK